MRDALTVHGSRFTKPAGGAPAACVFAALAVVGCGGTTKELEGSLSTVVDLTYDSVQLIQSGDELALSFIRDRDIGEDTPLKLSYSLSGTAITTNEDIDLAADRPSGGERSTVTREVLDDPRKTFPRIKLGAVKFFAPPQPGTRIKGDLHFTFEEGTELGSGRTVFGPFEALVP